MYKWLVARGTVTIVQESNLLSVDIDPEGSASCVLTSQDAQEIAHIITERARSIWEASDRSPEPKASVDGDSRAFRLTVASGVVTLIAHDSKPFLALSYDGQGAALLTVTQAVALVQLIQHLLRELPEA
ncbi:hypothetical protein [Roseateles terrae]|uniref:Roadblock/LAMTOR2 domain-containing protein n=1 Tax=Roseateles terrae TaxID=431060 RepID=A0ABR6GYU5_9BURK|nr:hypothetical protein [Roseateles terrae]MBB3197287.1 hypothetical protein [Roseateles terrae]OWQ83652.1 hypothetical protein CDN98_21650 [Roseateles terrae]